MFGLKSIAADFPLNAWLEKRWWSKRSYSLTATTKLRVNFLTAGKMKARRNIRPWSILETIGGVASFQFRAWANTNIR